MKVSHQKAVINVILTIAEAEELEDIIANHSHNELEKALHQAIHEAMGKPVGYGEDL